jgi:hypothetical protein
MKKSFIFIILLVTAFVSCTNKSIDHEEAYVEDSLYLNPIEDSLYVKPMCEFVFGPDTCVNGYVYGRYLPVDQLDSTSIVASAKYVRYHNDSIALIFDRQYIFDLCLHSNCVYSEKEDAQYGKVKEFYFPEVDLGFAYDEWGEEIIYSCLYFDNSYWYSDYLLDGLCVTSDVVTALSNVEAYLADSVKLSVNIYEYDEETGLELDHVEHIYIKVWELIRSFYNNPISYGLVKDDKIVYINGDLTFVTPVGSDSNHLLYAFFAGYTIDNVADLEKLECIFMDDIKKIHIKEDVFVTESPE